MDHDAATRSLGPRAASRFDLPAGDIHVWRVPLEVGQATLDRLVELLSDDERRRAARFVFERDRQRFVACRGGLRELLGRYLSCASRALQLDYGSHGKPELAAHARGRLFFNVSHSADLALVALRRQGEVGVDLEQLRPLDDAEAIARRYFAPRELAAIQRHATEARTAAFFRCWTRKEALLKALGTGLAVNLHDVEVRLDDDPRIVALPREHGEPSAWRLYHLDPEPGYVGAVAARGDAQRLAFGEWRPGEENAASPPDDAAIDDNCLSAE